VVVLDPCTYNTTHFLTPPPQKKTLATPKKRSRHTRREDVHEQGYRRFVQDTDITDGHMFLHTVEVDLDMLHALVLNGVGGEVDGTNVVIVDEVALHQRSTKLLK
jgi:hypothetical protein